MTEEEAIKIGSEWAGTTVTLRRIDGGWVIQRVQDPLVKPTFGGSVGVVDERTGSVVVLGSLPPSRVAEEFHRLRAQETS